MFGCQDCDCHPGSSIDNNCDRTTGQCVCLRNIVGLKCDQPEPGYFIPDLHQLKYEIEDGFSKNKQVRYSFDEELFPKFSWKGYVHLNKVTVIIQFFFLKIKNSIFKKFPIKLRAKCRKT